MGSYKLTTEAKADVRRIYFYGLEQHGEARADRYLAGLNERFQEIADTPLIYPADDIRVGYRRSTYKSDVIYYRIAEDFVEIIAVLGSQDREAWL